MRFSVLSSGSKANSTFVEGAGVRILIDCGLSGRQTEIRLARLGIPVESLDAIIVTHEHSDHVYGLATMSRRHKLSVYANRQTASQLEGVSRLEHFETGSPFEIEGLSIRPFSIVHDAIEPVGFSIEADGTKFVHLTDLGRVTPLVRESIGGANALVIESNHDEDMLFACDYPWELKQRIASSHGHLSNESCGELLAEIAHPGLRHIVLGHLSENSNTPGLALETVSRFLGNSTPETLICAGRRQETVMIEVGSLERSEAAA